ncbi:MAG: uroporphyrinogen decarboxylase family protein [Promethearchaeota archaeon]
MNEKKPKELYKERFQRVLTTISLKEPDRVPIAPLSTFYASNQQGMSKKEAMYDSEKFAQATIKTFSLLNWDMVPPIAVMFNGTLYDILGVKYFKWPGAEQEAQSLKDNIPYQFVEGEYMKANEYREFFKDPTGFLLRKLLPRHYKNLEGFSEFPNLISLASGYMSQLVLPSYFALPQSKKMLQTIEQASQRFFSWIETQLNYSRDMKKLGYPIQFLNITQAPYDVVSEFFRGMRGTMLDMYRKPEELKALLELLVESSITSVVNLAKMFKENNIVFIPLHRGAEGFMSFEQFEEFYWPTLTKIMEGLIKNDLIPMPFFEGKYTDRFPYLTEFAKKHKGRLIYWFDQSDIIKGKEEFGGYACIKGNVPATLLVTGTPQQVEEYVKLSIEGCMEGGGYIVDGGVSGIPDESKPENVKAMTETVFKYGVYRK